MLRCVYAVSMRSVIGVWCTVMSVAVAAVASANAQELHVSADPSDKTKPAHATDISGVPGQGLTIKVDDAFSLNIRTRLQARYQLTVAQPDSAGHRDLDQLVNINTLRFYISGNALVPKLTYLFQFAFAGRDYRDGATSPVFDAYLDYKLHRDFNIQVGQFFVPFDRLRTVREWALQLADRPRPVQELTLDRDVGVVLYSDKLFADNSPFAVRLGAFGGGGTNLVNGRGPGALFVGRVELRPFGALDDDREGDLSRKPTPRLAVGAAVAANINTNRVRSTTGATFKSPTSSPYAGGTTDYIHGAADLVFKWSGFALQAEYLVRDALQDRVHSEDAEGQPVVEYTRSGHGWILQASYVFPEPIEVVGRVSRQYAFKDTDPKYIDEVKTTGQELAAGVNYYFNGHRLKVQADWIGRFTPSFERPDHALHAQVDATF